MTREPSERLEASTMEGEEYASDDTYLHEYDVIT
jgi:hypothetical protein